MKPKIEENKTKLGKLGEGKPRETSDLTFPGSGLLSHLTYSCPVLPFLSLVVTRRFIGAVRGQSGQLNSGTGP